MEFSSAIAFRHSIRYFSARPVPDPVLQAIAEDSDKGSLPAERPGLEDLDFDGEESRRDPFGVRRTEPGGYPAFDRLREPPALGALARSPGPDGSGRGGTRGAGA